MIEADRPSVSTVLCLFCVTRGKEGRSVTFKETYSRKPFTTTHQFL